MARSSFPGSLAAIVWTAAILAAVTSGAASAQEPSGTVMIDEYQPACIFSGNAGGGKLYF